MAPVTAAYKAAIGMPATRYTGKEVGQRLEDAAGFIDPSHASWAAKAALTACKVSPAIFAGMAAKTAVRLVERDVMRLRQQPGGRHAGNPASDNGDAAPAISHGRVVLRRVRIL
jgi:hypothetical protein